MSRRSSGCIPNLLPPQPGLLGGGDAAVVRSFFLTLLSSPKGNNTSAAKLVHWCNAIHAHYLYCSAAVQADCEPQPSAEIAARITSNSRSDVYLKIYVYIYMYEGAYAGVKWKVVEDWGLRTVKTEKREELYEGGVYTKR